MANGCTTSAVVPRWAARRRPTPTRRQGFAGAARRRSAHAGPPSHDPRPVDYGYSGGKLRRGASVIQPPTAAADRLTRRLLERGRPRGWRPHGTVRLRRYLAGPRLHPPQAAAPPLRSHVASVPPTCHLSSASRRPSAPWSQRVLAAATRRRHADGCAVPRRLPGIRLGARRADFTAAARCSA